MSSKRSISPESPEQIIQRLTTALELIRDHRDENGNLITGRQAEAIAYAALSRGESEHEE